MDTKPDYSKFLSKYFDIDEWGEKQFGIPFAFGYRDAIGLCRLVVHGSKSIEDAVEKLTSYLRDAEKDLEEAIK